MEWQDYVAQLLSQKSSFDGIILSFEDNAHSVGIPPIIKASVLMLDKMIAHQGKFNILVFPERIQSIFIFTLIKLLHNIAEGKIERQCIAPATQSDSQWNRNCLSYLHGIIGHKSLSDKL